MEFNAVRSGRVLEIFQKNSISILRLNMRTTASSETSIKLHQGTSHYIPELSDSFKVLNQYDKEANIR
jgi:hypothetical protein